MSINKKQLQVMAAAFFISFCGVLSSDLPSVMAQSSARSNVCGGANLSLSGSGQCDTGKLDKKGNCVNDRGKIISDDACADAAKVDSVIQNIVDILSVVIGVIAVIMIIIGGFRFVTSGGDSAQVTSAKNSILYALVGLVVVALAQFLVKFIISRFS